jgi:hypothetical protein
MSQPSDTGARLVIGLAAVAGALVLGYFSATPALECVPASEYATCTVSARALGLFEVSREQVAGVRSVALYRTATGGSDTPPHLVFRDATTSHDLGYVSQRFVGDWEAINAFAAAPTTAGLRLTPPFAGRTAGAYAAAAALALMGGGMLASAIRGRA